MEIRLKIDGMTCGGCRSAVQRVLAATDGVESVSVDLGSGGAIVSARPDVRAEALVAAVEDAGYDARIEPTQAGSL